MSEGSPGLNPELYFDSCVANLVLRAVKMLGDGRRFILESHVWNLTIQVMWNAENLRRLNLVWLFAKPPHLVTYGPQCV